MDRASHKVLAGKVAIILQLCHSVDILQVARDRDGEPQMQNIDQGIQGMAQGFVKAAKNRKYPFGKRIRV